MATVTNHLQKSAKATNHSMGTYDRLIEKLKFNHFALISMAILIGSCAGGIAAMYIFQSGAPFWQFLLGLCISMANLIACIAQASTKTVFTLFMSSVVVNLLLVLSHI